MTYNNISEYVYAFYISCKSKISTKSRNVAAATLPGAVSVYTEGARKNLPERDSGFRTLNAQLDAAADRRGSAERKQRITKWRKQR